jgi:hypothetical protein
MTPSLQLPDKVRIIVVYGVPYWIEWERMQVGCSFFMKTTAKAAHVQRCLRPAEDHLRIELKARQRHEMGFYGVRVWRMS